MEEEAKNKSETVRATTYKNHQELVKHAICLVHQYLAYNSLGFVILSSELATDLFKSVLWG